MLFKFRISSRFNVIQQFLRGPRGSRVASYSLLDCVARRQLDKGRGEVLVKAKEAADTNQCDK